METNKKNKIEETEFLKISEELKKKGLNNPKEWAKILIENIPISNIEGLNRLKPSYFEKISSFIKNEIDKEILKKIFKFNDNEDINTKNEENKSEFEKIVDHLDYLKISNSDKWAKLLMEKIPVKYVDNLDHLRPKFFLKIESFIDNDIDRDILKILFNINKLNKEEIKLDKEERNKKIDDLMSNLNKNKANIDINKDKLDKELTSLMAQFDLNLENFKPNPEYRKDLIERFNKSYESIQNSGKVDEKPNITIEELAATAGEATLLRGVYYRLEDLDTTIKERDQLINCPSDIQKLGVQKPDIINEVTTENNEEHGYIKEFIKKSGDSFGVTGGGSYFGVTISASVENSKSNIDKKINKEKTGYYFYSKFKYNFCPLQTLSFNPSSLELTENAIKSLELVEYHIDNNENDKAKKEINLFFEKYGSHAKTGPFLFGGIFIINSSAQTNTKEKSSEVINAVANQLSINAGISGFGFNVGTSYSENNEEVNANKKFSQEISHSCKTTIEYMEVQKHKTFWNGSIIFRKRIKIGQ
jgi:hypothetical protein